MKLLQVFNSIEFSGAEIMARVAAPYLQEAGWELHALSTGNQPGAYVKILENAGYTIHHRPLGKTPAYIWKLTSWLKKQQFDAIHLHAERGFVLNMWAARWGCAGPLVRTIHTNFGFAGSLKWRKRIERKIAASWLNINFVAIGPSVAEHERNSFGTKPHLIGNWVDEKRFFPRRNERDKWRKHFGYSPEDILILTVGSAQEVKQHHHILQALAKVPNPKVKYLQVGDGELLDQNRAMAKELGLEDRVQFIPRLEQPEQAYAAADIFVMTSKYEGLSIAALEAMNSGLPVIFYKVRGLKDMLEHGDPEKRKQAGRLIEPNPEALAKQLDSFLQNPEQLQERGEAAYQLVREVFSAEKSIGEYIKLYSGEKA